MSEKTGSSETRPIKTDDAQHITNGLRNSPTHNHAPAIPPNLLNEIFNPMKAGITDPASNGPSGNLGPGFYIADRIVFAHQGIP